MVIYGQLQLWYLDMLEFLISPAGVTKRQFCDSISEWGYRRVSLPCLPVSSAASQKKMVLSFGSGAPLRTGLLLASMTLFVTVCEGRSEASRGVVVPFVFDPNAVCDPPCKHAGICIRNNTCFCSKGYEGELCQYADCYPKCKNGGECLRPGKCRCPPGFGGKYCHKVVCDGGCWNGGDCLAVNGVVKCVCTSSWTGSKCQEAICPQGCRHGGNCVAPGVCSCPDGWLGGACHTAVCTRPCLNGGKCVSPEVCRCHPLFSGPRCEERKKLF